MTQNTTNKYYVYGHYRLDTNTLFYVGKGIGYRATTHKSRNQHWKRIVAKHGYSVFYFCIDMTEQEAFDLEIAIITDLSPEANYAPGGIGGRTLLKFSPEEVKEIMRKRVYTKSVASYGFEGRQHSEETKRKIREGVLRKIEEQKRASRVV